MDALLIAGIAVNLLLVGVVVYLCCITKPGIEFNHVLTFSAGYVFYWIVPVIVGGLRLFETTPDTRLWYELYDAVPPENLTAYVWLGCLFYLAFAAGSVFVMRKTVRRQTPLQRVFPFPRRLLDVYLALGVVAAAAYAFVLRGDLFRGYGGNVYTEYTTRGSFTAVATFLLALAFVHLVHVEEAGGGNAPFRRLVLNRFFISYFVVAVLVLSMGGRLYLITSILMLLAYRSMYRQPVRLRSAAASLGVCALLAGMVGVVRIGSEASKLLLNLFAEPLFTSFSLMHFLAYQPAFAWVNLPIYLMGDFTNLLPTALFPDKQLLQVDPQMHGYTVFAPLGALHSYFSFSINFGIIGTVLVLFLLSFGLSCLRNRGDRVLARVIYTMLTGWLAFSFFRDPFSISVVKNMFQFSIVIPMLLVFSLHLAHVVVTGRSRQRAAGDLALGSR